MTPDRERTALSDLQDDVDVAVERMRRSGTDLERVEAKSATRALPKSTLETLSAFANREGGLLVLGIDESRNFEPTDIDAPKIAADLASACAESMDPPLRARIDIVLLNGRPVVAAFIEPLPPTRRPCFVKTRGMNAGSYLRTHDGDRLLSPYEVHVLVAARGQPSDDMAIVEEAREEDLEPALRDGYLHRLRTTRPRIFADKSDEEILRLTGVTKQTDGGSGITLAGLLAMGRYPQQYYPQLNVTFVVSPRVDGESLADGTRFLDNRSIDGPVPVMLLDTLEAIRRSMKRRSVIVGFGREDRWEYPEEAVREIVANALMHRDYHPLAHGTQVSVTMYPDRLEVFSPGGLHGVSGRDELLSSPVSSSRNARLAKILEDVEVSGTAHTVAENRGSGLLEAVALLRRAGIEPPRIRDEVRSFRITIHNEGLLDEDALRWLERLGTEGLGDRHRLALAFAKRHGSISNEQFRTLSGCESLVATRELSMLAGRGYLEKDGDRRWAVWRVSGGGEKDRLDEMPLFARPSVPPRRASASERAEMVKDFLSTGSKSTREIAEHFGVSPQAVSLWLRPMEEAGTVRHTEKSRRSKTNRWKLV